MNQKRVKITIDKKGDYTIEALEGFSGTSCVEQTKTLEVAIGGSVVSEGKTGAYYDPDSGAPVSITM